MPYPLGLPTSLGAISCLRQNRVCTEYESALLASAGPVCPSLTACHAGPRHSPTAAVLPAIQWPRDKARLVQSVSESEGRRFDVGTARGNRYRTCTGPFSGTQWVLLSCVYRPCCCVKGGGLPGPDRRGTGQTVITHAFQVFVLLLASTSRVPNGSLSILSES